MRGLFLSDSHMPDNINLSPVIKYAHDFKPDVIILGGDIIDAKGLHASESLRAEQVNMDWYERDVKLLKAFIKSLPKSKIVYLEGNHEERYARLNRKYPKIFRFNLPKDSLPKGTKWIPYGQAESYYRVGDCVFIHGRKYPDSHAKLYATHYTPHKIVYGHLHHLGAYSTYRPVSTYKPCYSITPGCLAHTNPEWKKGDPNQWVNGFISFVSENGTTIPSVHLIERGRFYVGGKCYQ